MDINALLNVGVSIFGAFVVAWLNHRSLRHVGRKSKALLEMEFLTSFLSFDLSHRPRVIVEQAFAIQFNYRYNYDEIVAVLKFLNPYRSLMLLQNTKEIFVVSAKGKFEYKSEYLDAAKRNRKRIVHYIKYAISIMLVFSPLMYLKDLYQMFSYTNIFSFVIVEIALLIYSIGQVSKAVDIESAEAFIVEQEKSIQAGLLD